MSPSLPSIAVLDDEPGFRQALGRLLKTHGFDVEPFASGGEFIAAASQRPFACLLLDLHMPGTTGFDVLAELKARGLLIRAIVITGHDQPGSAEQARRLGAANYLLKPLDESALLAALREAVPALRPPR
jgi:FixJ family two-component response regulator